ncbi:Glutamyl-tRNA(Gln) amidotransferase subunit A [Rhynchospora pubera]|uniref:Glutamyl-tRNA(Gln) amidotransferase subunit A n=1 Tax=Rhynchospora pubera TaxID=906938 RepID=A0AAV8CZJ0_9POAL|nr:Glutamyl-tRNA(Gln) amidotransferase subunit A [Rhynchospora pubera]
MGKMKVMPPVEEVDLSSVKYQPQKIDAPHLTGFSLKLFVWLMESPVLGPLIISALKNQNKMTQLLRYTLIPERPMYRPEFPPQEPEQGVVLVDEERDPIDRLHTATYALPKYDPSIRWSKESPPFLYWKIRDYAHAYRHNITTPSLVAEQLISAIKEWSTTNSSMPMLIHFNPDNVRSQAEASTSRFVEGKPISILDGIFIAIKDDVDCYPFPSRSGTSWFDQVRKVDKDATCVARLRKCGAILIGKANMHELGLGVTGNNPNHGTARNPHALDRYTGGSSSGPASIVSSGLCPAAIGTDGGGSVRIPSSLCGIVGLKTTYGRTDMTGVVCDGGTVEVVSQLAASVEDAMLVYSAIAGSSPSDKISLRPSPLSLPTLSSSDNLNILQSVKLGKYSEWFHDVSNTEISTKCEDALQLLCSTFGSQIEEIVLPELEEMRTAHIVSIGSESLFPLNPYCLEGRRSDFTLDTRTSLALFGSFSASDYVACQRLRRRIMYYFMEAFKKVDIIVTPTTGMTSPKIPPSALKVGESDYDVSGYLMRFVQPGNLLGLPAISVPIGHDKDGLPIGLQLIGRPWAEASLLRAAFALEELCLKFRNRPSGIFFNLLTTS